MAEDQGKEEEQFDFTGGGEAVGYISLEQARVRAMQTARETPASTAASTKTFAWPSRLSKLMRVRITAMSVPTTAVALLTVS